MIVRAADFSDWNQLAAMVEASNREMAAKYDAPDYTRAHLSVCMAALREYGGLFVAEKDDILVGYIAWVSPPDFPVGVVEGLGTYVLPEFRKTGVAAELRAEAVEWHRKRGGTRVFGVVNKGNVAGLAASVADGFEVVGLLMRKDIPKAAQKTE